MRKEFLVERQGRTFVLYAGILSLAHEQGLKSITTTLHQIPTDDNGRVAICTAIVVLEKDGVERVFTGIGDAAPNNVTPAMLTCLIRMAETRAKARAMRDAVNVAEAALEEMGDEENMPSPVRSSSRRQVSAPAKVTTAAKRNGWPPINDSGEQCPACYALHGKQHLPTCPSISLQKVA